MYCECGCGQITKIAQQTDPKRQMVKGEHVRFCVGHNKRKKHEQWWIVDPETGHWNWQLGRQGRYGSVQVDGKRWLAHVYVYTILRGPLRKGAVLHHTCDNRYCVNPDHLEPKTHLEHAHLHHPREIKEFCDHGHEMTPENTAIRYAKRGKEQRRCRICERESGRRYRERKGA